MSPVPCRYSSRLVYHARYPEHYSQVILRVQQASNSCEGRAANSRLRCPTKTTPGTRRGLGNKNIPLTEWKLVGLGPGCKRIPGFET